MRLLKLIPLLYVCLLAENSSAQFNNITTYTTSQGLSSNFTTCLLPAKDGFLWIATINGLNRFDGNRFVSFQRKYGDSTSLYDNFITGLYEDSSQVIWLVSPKSISRWQPAIHGFVNYPVSRFSSRTDESMISVLSFGKKYLLVITNHALYKLEISSGRIDPVHLPPLDTALKKGFLYSALFLEQNTVAVAAGYRFFICDLARETAREVNAPLLQNAEGVALAYFNQKKQELMISTYNKGLLIYHSRTGSWSQYQTHHAGTTFQYDPVYSIRPVNDSAFLFSSELQAGLFHPHSGRFTNLLPGSLFAQTVVRHACMDAQQTIWVATSNGLLRAQKDEINFRFVEKIKGAQGTFATVQFSTTPTAVYTSNYDFNPVYRILLPELKYEKLPLVNGLLSGTLRYVFRDKSGNNWLSTDSAVFLQKKGMARWEQVQIPGVTNYSPRNFQEDADGRIWLRLRFSGLFYYEAGENSFKPFPGLQTRPGSAFSGMVMQNHQTEIWISESNTGFYVLNTRTNKTRFVSPQLHTGIKNFERIEAANDSMIWISDERNGIIQYNSRNGKGIHYTTENGLLTNTNEVICTDPQGRAWTFCAEGVSVIDPSSGGVRNLRHPLLTRIQNMCISPDGDVFVATDRLILQWVSAGISTAGIPNQLYPDYAQVMHEKMPWLNGQTFAFRNNDVSLYFGVLNLAGHHNPSLEYRFSHEKEWKEIPGGSAISFSRLSPGSYYLSIRQKNDPEEKNWLTARWKIRKALWQTTGFWLTVLLLAGGLVYLLTRYRYRHLQQRALLKQKVAETERMALRAQMNPHFIFNCISSIDNFILSNDKENASAWLNKFAKLIRSILDSSKHEVIPFWKDWETLRLYTDLELLRADYRYQVSMEADPLLLNGHYRVPPLLVQPYVENAIHHGLLQGNVPQGRIQIHAVLSDNTLIYRIEDNGIGRARAAELHAVQQLDQSSYGMQMTAERIALFNGTRQSSVEITDLFDEKGNPGGTRIEIRLAV